MRDEEFQQLAKKFFLIVIIVLIFTIPVFFIFSNKLLVKENEILKDMKKEKDIVIYITKNNCENCSHIKKKLDSINLKYKELNVDNKDYNNIINKLEIDFIEVPALLYIEDGKLYSYIIDIKSDEEAYGFLTSYNLI